MKTTAERLPNLSVCPSLIRLGLNFSAARRYPPAARLDTWCDNPLHPKLVCYNFDS